MLFNYRFVNHSVEKLQEYLDHLVKEVWCKAEGDFSVENLHPELREIVIAVADDNSIKLKLLEPIREIFDLFRELPAEYRAVFGSWHDANNNIEALCANDPTNQPCTFEDIELIDEVLAVQLKSFCLDLWGRVIDLSCVKSRIGTVADHYVAFVKENIEGKCPFCGFGGIKGQYHSVREAYDHFLPKGTYPFNSVNFKNLAPICHECNSSYKLSIDPTRHLDPIKRRNNNTRRRAFYSYGSEHVNFEISVKLNSVDIDTLTPADIELKIVVPGREEEVESWKDVFGIEERYKANLCGKNDGKYWLIQALDERANGDAAVDEHIEKIRRAARHSPWAECNFLKDPFLAACQDSGLI